MEIRIVLDGPPGSESGRFIEVEDASGRSVNAGEWHERDDGMWELRLGAVDERYRYRWPICWACWQRSMRPALSVEYRGPVSERQKESHAFEVCSVCRARSIMGLYLREPYPFVDSQQVPPRMWVKITGTEVGIPIDTVPSKSFRENVRWCQFAAERALKTEGIQSVGMKLSKGVLLVGEITGSEGVWPVHSLSPEPPAQQPTCIKCGFVGCGCDGKVFGPVPTVLEDQAKESSLISIKGVVATELGRIQRDDTVRQGGIHLTREHLEERVTSLEQTIRDIHVTFEFMREHQKDEAASQGRTVDVDGMKDRTCDIRYIGKATEQPDGTWRCLADVSGALCVVEVKIREVQ